MTSAKTRLGGMRTQNINCRIPDELKPVLDYLKVAFPGGISGWVVRELRKVKIDRELLAKIKNL